METLEMYTTFLLGYLEGRDQFGEEVVNRWILLKWLFKEGIVKVLAGFNWLRIKYYVDGSCEQVNALVSFRDFTTLGT
jgi:hypothetical protein